MNERYFATIETQAASVSDVAVRGSLSRLSKLHRDILATSTRVRGNADLSAQGKTKEGRDELKKKAHELIRANLAVQRLSARIDEKRANIQLPAIDKTDAAGAFLRGQVRDRLPKSAKELRATIPTMSLLYLQAILEAPELVGGDRETVEAARGRAIDLVHPGKSAELDGERDAVRLLANATAAMSEAARELAELPNVHALGDFLNKSVPDQRHIEAAIESELAA
ncbi:hypothetical protein IVB33_29040 [Bradyrhizobium sp. 24]|uniref:hypothetical protein n=1 Tax=unclassified Bradyrhizobium TaxID=2631580 RepID=UPI001FF7B6C6|nr:MULTISPECIES: hypothetical protein [unclassified Bradyrhizobium]MCK1302947.1 hypothetical protein [Bradyrhizobium sp. 37]MCK1380998.1 hypothetical protein [Bradyrhizobium sp. 24]MCK1772443.1 hypothetical protein [Bradyrhizobium sp. 134]